MWTKAKVVDLFERLKAANPDPKSELNFCNHFTLLVAVVLSAQATDKGVNKATEKLFPIADTPEKMLALGEAGLTEHVKTVGLYRNKVKNILALSRMLIEQHGGEVPADREALEALPGVGRKTANVVLNVGFGQKTLAVDTHIFRVANRTNLAPGKDPTAVELGLLKKVPDDYLDHAHHWLLLHGRYTCTARNPKCTDCQIRDLCEFKEKPGDEMVKPKRKTTRKKA